MVEPRTRFRSYDHDVDGFDEDLTNSQPAAYRFGRSARNDYTPDQSVPLFLSDPDGEPEPHEFVAPPRKRGLASVTSKILLLVVAASGAAALFTWFSSDATRDIIVNAKASISAAVSPTAAANTEGGQLTAVDLQLKDPTRMTAPAPAPGPRVVATATAPSREEISTAYQAALRSAAPAAATPPVPVVTPPAAAAPAAAVAPQVAVAPPVAEPAPAPQPKRIDGAELATLMKRAKDFLAMGDVPAARLLLERAAEAQNAEAALMLARTYDPAVLGPSDVRNITPEPDKARAWYQKAAQFGSAEARQRLAQLPAN
ncbi:hypothetical protein [Bradyrhizobium sp. ARR65]|uniref:hypothetical protein n=1 Tax=Bradyrhizobium sp. ARR65 TaxID=1040989 RepID=UPI0005541E45|nr:hypothetical protein [Bradyrhizobium sp. ARR65]